MDNKERLKRDLINIIKDLGFDSSLGEAVALNLGSEKTMSRMIGYLLNVRPKSEELIVDEMLAIMEDRKRWIAKKEAEYSNDKYNELFDKATDISQKYLVGSQMWYVGALVPTLVVFGVMCIVTILLTRKSFKMFTPNIAYAISKGRKRR